MIVQYRCSYCSKWGEAEVDLAEWLNLTASSICKGCSHLMEQINGELTDELRIDT